MRQAYKVNFDISNVTTERIYRLGQSQAYNAGLIAIKRRLDRLNKGKAAESKVGLVNYWHSNTHTFEYAGIVAKQFCYTAILSSGEHVTVLVTVDLPPGY